MRPNALVTGACGFVGRHIARHMAKQGWRIIGLGHGSWSHEEWTKWGIAEWHDTDITLAALAAHAGVPDTIMHCAGGSSVGLSLADPYQDFQRTVSTTAALLEFVRLYAPQARVVYPSSGSVYGVVGNFPIAESAAIRPESPYALHKLMAEQLCANYAKNFGIASAVVRLFSVYGAGLHKQLLWDACRKIRAGTHDFFGTGAETRDWLHVDDAATLMMIAAQQANLACPVINGGTGVSVAVREVLQELFDVLDKSGKPAFTGAVRAGDPPHFLADIRRATGYGWQPQVRWQEGVREYAAWFNEGAP